MRRLAVILILLSAYLLPVYAQRDNDEQSVLLDTVTIDDLMSISTVRTMTSGAVDLNLEMMDLLPKMMGNADPVSYSKLLPGVQTSGEYDGGLHINGCENSHNMVSVMDVPLYNVNHLLGFFSAFIPTHYSSMSLYKIPQTAGASNRLGGELLFRPDSRMDDMDKLSGSLSTGLISTQGTVKVPTGKKSLLTASFRDSYINLLYSKWLTTDRMTLLYSFYDSNLTWSCEINDRNLIMADAYYGRDKASLKDPGLLSDIRCKWGNDAESLHLIHKGKGDFRMKHLLYRSANINNLDVDHEQAQIYAPSSITDLGYKGSLGWRHLSLGAEILHHDMTLQVPVITGTYNSIKHEIPEEEAWEYSAYGDYNVTLGECLSFNLGVRGNIFAIPHKTFRSVDPSFAVTYYNTDHGWSMSVNLFQRHQYLFMTGYTDVGLPTEFWMPASEDLAPQYMRGINLSGQLDAGNGYTLNASVYFKKLYNQVEYYGSMIDFIASDFNLQDHLIKGNGYNYGFDLMLSKDRGRLTGWVGYSYGRARRRFDDLRSDVMFPASHERLHELDVVAMYETGKRWKPSATLVAAGGTPFTVAEHFFVLDREIFVKYGEFNGKRMNPYIRLDLSVNYDLKVKSGSFVKSQGLNLSLYNVLCRSNDLGYRLKVYKDNLYYTSVSFLSLALPSISYYCTF